MEYFRILPLRDLRDLRGPLVFPIRVIRVIRGL